MPLLVGTLSSLVVTVRSVHGHNLFARSGGPRSAGVSAGWYIRPPLAVWLAYAIVRTQAGLMPPVVAVQVRQRSVTVRMAPRLRPLPVRSLEPKVGVSMSVTCQPVGSCPSGVQWHSTVPPVTVPARC